MTQTEIDAYIAGYIGPDALDPAPDNPNIKEAQANSLSTSTADSHLINSGAVTGFMTKFNNWSALVLAGKIPNTDPPKVPNGVQALTASNGWTYIVPGTEPVTTMPPIPSVPVAPTGLVISIGVKLYGNFWSALPDNSVPDGTPMPIKGSTSKDGTTGDWNWVKSPFGGWWEKVA